MVNTYDAWTYRLCAVYLNTSIKTTPYDLCMTNKTNFTRNYILEMW